MEFSRAYLQSLPEKRRQDAIDARLEQLTRDILQSAMIGKTSYTYTFPNAKHFDYASYTVTPKDLVEGLSRKFPDCHVTLIHEDADIRFGPQGNRTGILVDWS
jgi:hypothetical protein